MAEPRTSEYLIRLGTEVANKFVQAAVPMTDTIKKLASSMNLEDEEVRRVCEHANKATFVKLFHSAPLEDKVVNFPLADANEILHKEVLDKAAQWQPAVSLLHDNYTKRNLNAQEDFFEKAAAYETPAKEEKRNVQKEWSMTKRACEIIRGEHTVGERLLDEARIEFLKEAEDTLMSNSLDETLAALLSITKEGDAQALTLLKPVIEKVKNRGMLKEAGLDVHAVLDSDHPLLVSYTKMLDQASIMLEKDAELAYAMRKVEELNKEIRNA